MESAKSGSEKDRTSTKKSGGAGRDRGRSQGPGGPASDPPNRGLGRPDGVRKTAERTLGIGVDIMDPADQHQIRQIGVSDGPIVYEKRLTRRAGEGSRTWTRATGIRAA